MNRKFTLTNRIFGKIWNTERSVHITYCFFQCQKMPDYLPGKVEKHVGRGEDLKGQETKVNGKKEKGFNF